MKKLFIGFGVIAVASAICLTACKKKDDNNNSDNSAKIIGSWVISFNADDVNNNNVLDASEKVTAAAADYERITFRADHTLADSSNGISFSGTYSVSGDYVTVFVLGDTLRGKLYQLDNNNMVIQDTSQHPTSWTGYTR